MPITPRLEALRKRQAEIAAKIAQAESTETAKARKEDTRLKVIVGAGILADVVIHPETRAGLMTLLNRAIKAARDREFLQSKGWL